MLFFAGACLLYWGRKTRFHGLVTRYYRGVRSVRAYIASTLGTVRSWVARFVSPFSFSPSASSSSSSPWTASSSSASSSLAAAALDDERRSSRIVDTIVAEAASIDIESQQYLLHPHLHFRRQQQQQQHLADQMLLSFITPRTIFLLFLRCLLLGLAFAFYQVVARVKRQKREVLQFMRDVEAKLQAERARQAQEEQAESRREELEELQKFPDELFMKIANRMWEVMMEHVEHLGASCHEHGTLLPLLLRMMMIGCR